MKRLNRPIRSRGRVLCLGYPARRTGLIGALIRRGHEVWHTAEPLRGTPRWPRRPDTIVSFGYRHVIGADTLAALGVPVVNLHISYLPWNRGAHPNFWALHDATPSGVTVHLMDAGVDTGPVLYRRRVRFDRGETTFVDTQARLIREIEALFAAHLPEITARRYAPRAQRRAGSVHRVRDLPADFAGWGANVTDELRRLRERTTDRAA